MDTRKEEFIRRLAEYLVENEAAKGIAVGLESAAAPVKWASEWAKVRAASPVSGYTSIAEAVEKLKNFLG
jgi:hypothetical protein